MNAFTERQAQGCSWQHYCHACLSGRVDRRVAAGLHSRPAQMENATQRHRWLYETRLRRVHSHQTLSHREGGPSQAKLTAGLGQCYVGKQGGVPGSPAWSRLFSPLVVTRLKFTDYSLRFSYLFLTALYVHIQKSQDCH